MKCPSPNCKKDISPGSKFCSECGTPIPQALENEGDAGGVQTGDIGYMEGSISDKSMHGAASVGSINISVAGATEQQSSQKKPSIVTCPICGRRNDIMNTFKCMKCHKDNLCLRHQDEDTNLCQVCTREDRARIRIERLEREVRDAEAADDLQEAIFKLDQLIELAENRQAACEWKARLVQEIEKRQKEEPGEPFSIIENTIGMKFVLLPAGTFTMGSPSSERDRDDDEDQHRVTLAKGFYIQTTPVTVGEWREFMLDSAYKTEAETGGGPPIWSGSDWEGEGTYWEDPGHRQDESHPVTCVTWNDVQKFIKWLRLREGTDKYRLPAEAEWEYASRSGSDAAFCFGDDEELLGDYGWYDENSNDQTQPVGHKKANGWGSYDMHGNVWEWCQDWYGDYPAGSVTDPKGLTTGSNRVFRGGGWGNAARSCRSAIRNCGNPGGRDINLGFRLARDP